MIRLSVKRYSNGLFCEIQSAKGRCYAWATREGRMESILMDLFNIPLMTVQEATQRAEIIHRAFDVKGHLRDRQRKMAA